jgi:group I intron endonuclease
MEGDYVPENSRVYIYFLVEKGLLEPRYVGYTVNPTKRLQTHISRALYGGEDTYKARWIRELEYRGLEPEMLLVEETTPTQREGRERFWIKLLSSLGFRLTNLTEGGDGVLGYRHTPESIGKFSSKLKGQPKSKEHRAKLAKAHLGKKASEETKAKMSVTRTGKKMKPESIEKTAAAHRGLKRSESAKQKMKAAWIQRRLKKGI